MLEKIPDPNVRIVYGAIFLLGVAYGVPIALTSILLHTRGYTKEDIGTLAAFFASGIVALSLPMGSIIKRYSARKTLIGALVGYALAVGTFPFLHRFPALAAVRVFDGMCSVGIWVSCETILLSRADKRYKAFVVSLYAICMGLGYVIGPIMSYGITHFAPLSTSFVVAGCIAMSAAVLVALKLDADVVEPEDSAVVAPPDPSAEVAYRTSASAHHEPTVTASAMELLARIKTSCFATFAYGYFQASVVLFLPLFLIESKNIPVSQTTLIPAFFAAGMLSLSNLTARVGDRHGHLMLMRVLGFIGTLMVLGFVYLDAFWAMGAAVFIAGATLASISPVSLALQGAVVARKDYPRANSIYNAFYASGMLFGPIASSWIFQRYGGATMLYHLAAMWAAFVVFATVYRADDPSWRGHAALKPA